MIRSSKISVKFSNINKLNNLRDFIKEYKFVTQKFVDILWDLEKTPKFIPKDITDSIKEKTWLSARILQCSAKQASGIVRGTKKKNEQRLYIWNQLNNEGKFKQARKLKKIIDKNPVGLPDIKTICPELDSRFVKIDMDNKTSFDGWITLSSLGNKLKIKIPFRKTSHFNHMLESGTLKEGIRLSENNITFNFNIEDKPKKDSGITLGLDIGISKVFTTSDKQLGKEDIHGWNLSKIQNKLSRKHKGSKGFERVQQHRKNYINWSLNQLNLNDVKILKLEKIKDLRRNNKVSRFMSHWTYTDISYKLESLCEEHGVQTLYINPTYTSQRCSKCGWVRKSNRKGNLFKCKSCGFTLDADLNASLNISFDLPSISKKKRLSRPNIVGFYWNEISKESIVPCAQEPISYFS